MAISGLHWLLVKPDGPVTDRARTPAVRARSLDVMRRLVGLCAELGGELSRPWQPGAAPPARRRRARRAGLGGGGIPRGRRGAAAQAGVVYCVEPLAPRLTNCFNSVAEAAAFVRRGRQPALRTMLDTLRRPARRDGDAGGAARALAADRPDRARAPQRRRTSAARARARIAFAPVLRTLHAHGWDRWIGIEPFEYVPDGPTCAARAIGYVRGIEETLR